MQVADSLRCTSSHSLSHHARYESGEGRGPTLTRRGRERILFKIIIIIHVIVD